MLSEIAYKVVGCFFLKINLTSISSFTRARKILALFVFIILFVTLPSQNMQKNSDYQYQIENIVLSLWYKTNKYLIWICKIGIGIGN